MKRFCFVVLLFLSTYLFAEDYTIKVNSDYTDFITQNVRIYYDCIITEITPVNDNYCKIVYFIQKKSGYPLITEYIKLKDELQVSFKNYNFADDSVHDYHYTLIVKSFTYNRIETEITEQKK